ncbi:MAG: hypothetical protein MZV63_53850 [Marinilabiliales bacterium]|nr:hypothetical protein [Marinilabiliales bacterium]
MQKAVDYIRSQGAEVIEMEGIYDREVELTLLPGTALGIQGRTEQILCFTR